jgi:hypothetical protein
MSKKRLSGCRPHWPNDLVNPVSFSSIFSPTIPKPEHAVLILEINWRNYFDLLQLLLQQLVGSFRRNSISLVTHN